MSVMAKISSVTRFMFPVPTPIEMADPMAEAIGSARDETLGAGRKYRHGSHRWRLVGRRAVFRAPILGRSDRLCRMSLVPTATVATACNMVVISTRPLSV